MSLSRQWGKLCRARRGREIEEEANMNVSFEPSGCGCHGRHHDHDRHEQAAAQDAASSALPGCCGGNGAGSEAGGEAVSEAVGEDGSRR